MQQYADIYSLQYYSTCFGCCDTRNMYSSIAANKYLHTVASVGFLFTQILYFLFSQSTFFKEAHQLKCKKRTLDWGGTHQKWQ